METADLYRVLYEDALGTYRSWGTKRACANRIGMERAFEKPERDLVVLGGFRVDNRRHLQRSLYTH